jgi:tetratricopeptide (TPR) repeat protein
MRYFFIFGHFFKQVITIRILMIARTFAFLFFFFQGSVIQAQMNKNIHFDSLINLCLSLSEKSIYDADFVDAEKYVQLAYFKKFEAFQSKHQLALEIQNLRIKSFKNRLQNIKVDPEESLEMLLRLKPVSERISDRNIIADYYSMLASAYFGNSEKELAFQYFDSALQLYIELENFYKVAQTRASIISLNQTIFQREKNKKALESMVIEFEKEIEFAKNHDNKYALSFNTRHLAQIYLRQLEDYEKAEELFEQSLSLREEIGFITYLPASYFSLGEVAEKMEDLDKAMKMYEKSYRIADEIKFVRYQFTGRFKVAEIIQKQGDINKAKSFYVDALKSASSNGYLNGIDEALKKIEALDDK